MTTFISGAIVGLFFVHFPWVVKYPNVDKLTISKFMEKYPDKRWRIRFLKIVPPVWILIYLFLFLPLVSSMNAFHDEQIGTFIAIFWFVGGIGFIDAIFEVVTSISPHRVVSAGRGGGTGVINVAFGDSVRKYGWLRIGLILTISIVLPVGVDMLNMAFIQ